MLLNTRKNLSFYYKLPFAISNPSQFVMVEDGKEITKGEGMKAKTIFTSVCNPGCITGLIDISIYVFIELGKALMHG